MGVYPARALDRAMKLQEVILRAVDGKITWMQAAEIIGISDRTMRRKSHERTGSQCRGAAPNPLNTNFWTRFPG